MRIVPFTCASLALLASGCFMDHGVTPETPTPEVRVEVTAAISGATLGDDCPMTGDADIDSGACAPDVPCPALCQQSNVQLAITTGAGDVAPLTWEVLRITLHDFETGEALQELTWRDPRVWDASTGYGEWDELLPAPSDLATSYDLSAPDWTTIAGRVSALWSAPFQIRMLVAIDGETRELVSGAVYRVSDIDT